MIPFFKPRRLCSNSRAALECSKTDVVNLPRLPLAAVRARLKRSGKAVVKRTLSEQHLPEKLFILLPAIEILSSVVSWPFANYAGCCCHPHPCPFSQKSWQSWELIVDQVEQRDRASSDIEACVTQRDSLEIVANRARVWFRSVAGCASRGGQHSNGPISIGSWPLLGIRD